MYITRDREAGNIIELFLSESEAKAAVSNYEKQDKKDGVYSPDFYEYLKADLSHIRKGRNMTQAKLAELSGISIRMIQQYEQGARELNKVQGMTLYKLAKALGCNIEDLLDI